MDMNTPTPVPSRSSAPGGRADWKKYLYISLTALIVLIAGIIIGSGLTIVYFGKTRILPPDTPGEAARLINARIFGAVQLTPDEQLKTEELVERRMAEIAEIRKKYEDEVHRALGVMRDDVGEVIGQERLERCGGWMGRRHSSDDNDSKNQNHHGNRRRRRH